MNATELKYKLDQQDQLGIDLDGPAWIGKDSISNLDMEIILFVGESMELTNRAYGRAYGQWRLNLNK